jgi:hypothetical protein
MHGASDDEAGLFPEWIPNLKAGLLHQGRLVTKKQETHVITATTTPALQQSIMKDSKKRDPLIEQNGQMTPSTVLIDKLTSHPSMHSHQERRSKSQNMPMNGPRHYTNELILIIRLTDDASPAETSKKCNTHAPMPKHPLTSSPNQSNLRFQEPPCMISYPSTHGYPDHQMPRSVV